MTREIIRIDGGTISKQFPVVAFSGSDHRTRIRMQSGDSPVKKKGYSYCIEKYKRR